MSAHSAVQGARSEVVKTTSGFSRHLGFAHICYKWHSRIRTPLSRTLKISHWVFEIILRQPYIYKICRFHFGGRHLGFLADVDVTQYRKLHYWKAWHRKYRDSRWNFIAMCLRIPDMPGGKNTPQLPPNVAKKPLPGQGFNHPVETSTPGPAAHHVTIIQHATTNNTYAAKYTNQWLTGQRCYVCMTMCNTWLKFDSELNMAMYFTSLFVVLSFWRQIKFGKFAYYLRNFTEYHSQCTWNFFN